MDEAPASTRTEEKRVRRTLPFDGVSLVFQGGGALGAYQAGVYQAIYEANIEATWICGTSIGAINGVPPPAFANQGDWGKCTPRRTAACKLAVITHTGSLGISPARNPASRLGYGRESADPISAGATIYSDGLVPNAIPKNGGRSAAHHGQCRSCCDGPQY